MGTRSLTCVFMDGKYVISKYCQWDGYPDGVGLDILDAIKKYTVIDMAKRFRSIVDITDQEIKDIYNQLGINIRNGLISMEDAQKFQDAYPELDRDMGGTIIEYLMQNPHINKLRRSLDFAADSVFCEWAYVVDLDKLTFEVYEGLNTDPLKEGERFFHMPLVGHDIDDKYYPVKLVHSFDLNELPDKKTFLALTNLSKAKIKKGEETN